MPSPTARPGVRKVVLSPSPATASLLPRARSLPVCARRRLTLGMAAALSCHISRSTSGHAAPAAAASEERVAEEEGPAWVELEPICSEQQLDRALAEAQQLDAPIVLVWMASWCRKCIYLKPKLEKLAAEYHPRIRFYSVDVNAVPQKLVNRAGVTKMPSIQLWSDFQKQAEVIGGHKSWLVIDDVRRMIEREE